MLPSRFGIVIAFSLVTSAVGACTTSTDDLDETESSASITSSSDMQDHLSSAKLSPEIKQQLAGSIDVRNGSLAVKASDFAALSPESRQEALRALGIKSAATGPTAGGGAQPNDYYLDGYHCAATGWCIAELASACNIFSCAAR